MFIKFIVSFYLFNSEKYINKIINFKLIEMIIKVKYLRRNKKFNKVIYSLNKILDEIQ